MAVSELEREVVDIEGWGIQPVPEGQRRLRAFDFAILWGDLAVSLLVIVAGSLLVPALSTRDAIAVIVIGTLAGAVLLALAGVVGSEAGVPTMVSLRPALGIRGSYVPSVLNILQLVGWAGLEIIVMAKLARGLSDHFLGFSGYYFWVMAFGVFGTLLAVGGPVTVVRQWMQKFGIWIVLVASLWLTVRLFDAYDFSEIWHRAGEGGFPTFWQGIDLVIALPVSWLPLVCDYSRFARKPSGAAAGTYIGYAIANIWFFALGALYVQALNTDPDGLINGQAFVSMLVPLSLGWIALIALLAGEADEVFANVYSTAVSLRNLAPKIPHAALAVLVGAVSIVVAISLDLIAYENFLLLIGGVFVPLFGIFLADYFAVRPRHFEVAGLYAEGGEYWYCGGFNLIGLAIWGLGFVLYALCAQPPWLIEHLDFVSWAPRNVSFIDDVGGTVPAFVFCFAAYWALARAWLPAAKITVAEE
jgi:nucleobase:cation symporter-1, NCS1 family